NTSTRPSRGLMRDFETSSGLKLPFAGFNARTRPGGFLAPRSYRPCLGLLPPMPEAVFATPRCWSFGHRARWSRNAWRPRPRRGRAATGFAFRSWSFCSAPIGYYFWTGGWSPPSRPGPGPKMTWLGPTPTAQSSAGQQQLPQLTARDDDRTLAQGEVLSQRPETPQPRRSPEGETVAALQPSPTGDQARAANKG